VDGRQYVTPRIVVCAPTCKATQRGNRAGFETSEVREAHPELEAPLVPLLMIQPPFGLLSSAL